jgi:RHS repeat-associated protein
LDRNTLNSSVTFLNEATRPVLLIVARHENGSIIVNNGEIHMDIPLATHTQRGRIPLVESLEYDSRIWQIVPAYSWQPSNVPNSMGGWRLVTNNSYISPQNAPTYITYVMEYGSCGYGQQQLPTEDMFYDFAWPDPQGTTHQFDMTFTQNLDLPPCQENVQNQSASGYAVDGSGYSMTATYDTSSNEMNFDVYDVNGNQVYPIVQDTNGNYYSSDNNGNLVDTLGRTPVLTTTSGNHIYYNVLGWNGVRNQYTVTTETVYYHTAFSQSAVSEASGSFTAVQSIQLPDGSSYQFTYDSGTSSGHYGELMSVTLPSGGVVQYTWQNFKDSFKNENRWIASHATSSGTTTFQPATITQCSGSSGCQEKTTVADPSGNNTVYTFTLNPGTDMDAGSWNTQVAPYQGTVGSGTELESVATNYTYSTTILNLPSGGGQTFIVPQTQTVQATLPAVSLTSQTVTTFNSTGALPTCVQNWDYYSGSAPAPTIQTNYTYYDNTGLPATIEAMDGTGSGNCNGSEVSDTTYSYDQTTPSTTSGLPNHATVTPFGNLTTMSQWINSAPVSYFTTTMSYDNAGTLQLKTDPNGTTSYGYDSTDTFAISTTPPTPSSGVALGSSASFDFSSGLLSGTKDPNTQPTTYTNYDYLGRVGEIEYPDGGKSIFGYAPADGYATTATESHVYQYQNSSTYADTETLYDGYGRAIRTATANGQGSNPWYEQDTCYNPVGEVNFRSYRYQAASLSGAEVCSGAGDTFAYDALGRTKTVTHADGTQVVTNYNGRAMQQIDEYSVDRYTQTDALGRTTAVCEITSTSLQASGAPASCGLDFSGTGYLTSYAYNLAYHTTTVTQGTQTRVFQTDSIGRPILTQEPESGQTTYSYTYNSNPVGLQVTRFRPTANQTNPNVTTKTITQDDAVGRPVTITYFDGTPTRSYAYDVAQEWGVTLLNPKGRMVLASSTADAKTIFGYDPMGRVNLEDECTPSVCGSTYFPTAYTYDQLGNELTVTDGFGVTTTYTYSPANEVLSITSSLSGSQGYNPNLVSNVRNGPFGPSGWALGDGPTVARQYDTMGRISGGTVNQGGSAKYTFTSGWTGAYLTSAYDSVLGQSNSYVYDQLGRLAALNVNSGTAGSYTYSFDRWGNRWAQTEVSGSGGPQPQNNFNAKNQITPGTCNPPSWSQICYDAAGNMIDDGAHAYSYDAEGNLTEVDSGNTAAYTYDALNQRVGVNPGLNMPNDSGDANEFVFNPTGQRVSIWDAWQYAQIQGKSYWGASPVMYYYDGSTIFELQDWMGTERMRMDPDGGQVEGRFTSLPWGDGYSVSGADYDGGNYEYDPNHFADLDQDSSGLEHAQYREYSNMSGRWMSPDPFSGSYNFTNPQSFNRYAYVNGRPLSFTDPSGLYQIPCAPGSGADICENADACGSCGIASLILDIVTLGIDELFKPKFHGSLKPTPSVSSNGVGPSPCANANPANLNYNAVNNYNSGPATALDHITQNHINSVPGKSTYWGFSPFRLGATGNMMRLNAVTLTQGTLMSVSSNGASVLTYYSPLTESQWGPFTIVQGNVGWDQSGTPTQFNTLVVQGCTNPQTSYPGLPFQP